MSEVVIQNEAGEVVVGSWPDDQAMFVAESIRSSLGAGYEVVEVTV